jgi:hypothetical protein
VAVVLDHEVAGRITLRERLAEADARVRDRAAVRIDDLALQGAGLAVEPFEHDRECLLVAIGQRSAMRHVARRAGQQLGAANGTCGEREVAVRATARDDRLFAGGVADVAQTAAQVGRPHDLQRGFGNRLAGPVAHVASEPHGWCHDDEHRRW